MKEETLTVFSGIPFNENEPYDYQEAKQILELAMEELRGRKDLVKQVNMNPKGRGRGAITGKNRTSVWDFLRLRGSKEDEPFTKYPHLTLGIQRDQVLVHITIPNEITASFRRNISNLGYETFEDLMRRVNRNLIKALRNAKGSAPWVEVVQRHYPSRTAQAIFDARLAYDLRTAFPSSEKQIKIQPEWLSATFDALAKKQSNLQVGVGANFPYRTCSVIKSPKILDYIAGTWIACKPLLDVMLED